MKKKKHVTSNQYKFIRKIGEGLTSEVYLAYRYYNQKKIRERVVVKCLKSWEYEREWKEEVQFLRMWRSQYSPPLMVSETISGYPALVFKDTMSKCLYELWISDSIDKPNITKICSSLNLALEEIHKLGLFHGDLSLKNVLVDHETNVYLIDGGLGNADKTRNFGLLQPKTLYQFQQRDLKQLKNIKKQLLKPSLQTVTKKLNPDLRLLNGLKGVHLKLYISLIVKTFIALIIVYQQKAMVSDILLSKIILKSPLWINIEKLGKGNLWRYHNIIFTTTDKLKLTTHQGSEKKTQVLKINPGDNIVFEW